MPNTIAKYSALKQAIHQRRRAYSDFILFPTLSSNPNIRGRLIAHLKAIAKPDEDMKLAIDFHVPNLMRRVDLLFVDYCEEYRLYA